MGEKATIRVIWKPGWFLGGIPVKFYLDDEMFHEGKFKQPVDTRLDVAPGHHELLAVLDGRPKRDIVKASSYDFQVGAGRSYRAEIKYSRMWGDFKDELEWGEVES